ncbi:hypothetical protein RSAG8_05208, partial [Rhizoctonia solani AG-8 WAC10335]
MAFSPSTRCPRALRTLPHDSRIQRGFHLSLGSRDDRKTDSSHKSQFLRHSEPQFPYLLADAMCDAKPPAK